MKFFKTRCAFVLQMGLLFVCYSVYTQNPSQIDVLTTEDGLVFRDVSGVVQDKKGLMWISTTQGLNRYDGHQFKAYTSNTENPYFIEEDFIRANMLYDDFDNSIWFLANDKLFQLHITTDSVVSYNEKHNLKGQVIGLFRAPDNAIWVVTDDNWISGKSHAKQYLQKYVDGNFEVMVATDRYKRGFNNISLDADGFIWWTTTKATYKYNIAGQLMETHIMDSYDWNGDIIHYVPQFFDSNNTHYYFPPSSGGIGVYVASKKCQKLFSIKTILSVML